MLNQHSIVPAAKAAGEIDAMTPQVCPVDAALVANVPGAPRYNLKRVIFNKTIDGLKHCVGAGTNHTTYERIKGVCKHGGADYFYNFGVALWHAARYTTASCHMHHQQPSRAVHALRWIPASS